MSLFFRENDGDVGMGEVDDRVKETEDEDEEQRKKVGEFFKQVAGDDNEVRGCFTFGWGWFEMFMATYFQYFKSYRWLTHD